MFYLRLFGNPTLESDDDVLSGRATQRHRIALLALLALAPGRRLSRDKLIASLWPERDPEGGRNLLKVSTYVLRSALGENALLSEGDDLRLDTSLLETDVVEFDVALERSDHARAVTLYRGPFLDGFFISEAQEFESWASRERERLAGGYRSALKALAEAAEATGNYHGAVEWWKVLAAHEPYDSRVALRLMQALEADGNPAGALQHAAVHRRMIQEEFGIPLPADVAALADRLRNVKEKVPDEGPAPLPLSLPIPSAEETGGGGGIGQGVGRGWHAFALAFMLVVLIGAVYVMWPRAGGTEGSIVVLPFTNLSAEQDVEYFSDGLTEEIITRLSAVQGLKVISRTSAMHYKGSKHSLPQIAGQLKVAHVLEGSVRHDNGRVRISAQLIEARNDEHVWAENYEYRLGDHFRVQEEIAQEVARALEVKLSGRARRLLAKQGTRDALAYEYYRRGRFLWNLRTREGHEQAIVYYHRAIERDSSFAAAYAGLADAYLTGFQLSQMDISEADAYSRVKWAAERAVALDDESADAHASFAIALWWQRNWPGAARELRRALELNPGHATARSWYALLLQGMGRSGEAKRESRLASEYDPFAVVALSNNAWICYLAHDYDCALQEWRRSLEVNPEWPMAYRGAGLTYALMGRHADAIAAASKAVELAPNRPDYLADLAYVQARAGKTRDARATLTAAKARPIEPFSIGRAHIALGERDSALVWLERSNWHFPHRAVRSDPGLDPVRSDPRFVRIVARVDRETGMK